jgi:predicted RND superfamily exporter protein
MNISIDFDQIIKLVIPLLMLFLKPIFTNPKEDEKELDEKRKKVRLIMGKDLEYEISQIVKTVLSDLKREMKHGMANIFRGGTNADLLENEELSDEIDVINKKIDELHTNREELLTNKLNDYFFSRRGVIKKRIDLENIFKAAKRILRIFNHAIVYIPFLCFFIVFVLWLTLKNNFSLILYLVIIGLSIALLLGLWSLKIHKKHKYFQMCEDVEGF